MKKIKYGISIIMILVGFLITGESYQLYLDNFETANYSTTLFLNGSPNNTEPKMVEDITKAAEQNDVQVYTVISNVQSMLLSERRIYGTSGAFQYIQEHLHVNERSYPSLLSGTKNVVFKTLNELPENEDLSNISQYYLIGSKDNIFNFKDSLNGIYAGNFPQEGYESSSKMNIFFVWSLISIVLLFLSYYDVILQKKESFIRISLGERTSSIVAKNIILDTFSYSLIFSASLLILQYYTNSFFYLIISVSIFSSMMFLNALLYSSLYFYNIKEALSDTISSKKLLTINYFLKTISVIITLTIVSSNIVVIVEGVHFYQQRSFFENHADYFYVKTQYAQTNEQDQNSSFEESLFVTETFYRKFFKDFDATQLVTSGVFGKNVILSNQNNLSYLQEQIPELNQINTKKGLYLVLPEHMKDDTDIINQLKKNYQMIEQNGIEYDYDIIYYGGNPKVIAIDEFSLNGSFYINSPVIILNNIDWSQYVDSANASHFRWDFAHDILYKVSPDQLANFIAENTTETNRLYYQLTNALEKYEYQWNIIKRTLYLNIILTFLILFLEFVTITTILRLEYKVNAVELSVKKVLGYTLWQKNRKILLITLIPTILGIIAASVVQLFNDSGSYFIYLFFASLIILVLETFIILYYIRKLERTSVPKILKGGSL
uniref:hypothetical protein n=1 Tax=Paenibacillus amylolyticus TaxID=1451 RepID=UPI000B83DE97|nr:hypothetical protein [Paenibacillus amylolyticus]